MSQRFTGAVRTGSSISFSGTGSFTVCGWAYIQNATAGDLIYMDSAGGASGGEAIWLGFEPSNWRFQNRTGGVGFDVSIALTLNQWHHLAMVYNGTNTTAYVDGAIVSGPTATTLTGRGTMNYLEVGVGGDVTLQDLMVFSSALTTAQIQYIMARQVPPPSVSAYAWYKLANAAPTTDSSGNGHTLSGAGNSNGLQILAAADGTTLMNGSAAAPGVASIAATGTVQMKGSNVAVPGIAAVTAVGTVLMNGAAVVTGGSGGVVQITATGTLLMSGTAAAVGVAAVSATGTVNMVGAAAAAALAAISATGTTRMSGAAVTTGGNAPFPNPTGVQSSAHRLPASMTGRRPVRR
jgi:concanavalin A-like lectin/glucanase superfamily protein